MPAFVSKVVCPSCGAPVSGKIEQRRAICIFCNTSLFLGEGQSTSAAATAAADEVSSEGIEQVKQLLVDGKRDEAVALYVQLARVGRDEAERAVDGVFMTSYFELTKHLPIGASGVVFYVVLIGIGVGAAALGVHILATSAAFGLLVVAGALFAFARIRAFARHLRATWVSSFGKTGKGRVLRRSVLRKMNDDAFYVIVQLEVAPDDTSAPFVDQETLFVGAASLEKLVPPNVIPVRFDGAREHVYPISPVTVIG